VLLSITGAEARGDENLLPFYPLKVDALTALWDGDDGVKRGRHRQLVRSGQPDAGDWQGGADLLPTRATDFCPDLEFLGPESSMLRGSDVIATEVEEVIDLVVG
jgi:hypothetical protein